MAMALKSSPTMAKVEQILLWYDQPEILLLSIGPFERIVAVSSGYQGDAPNIYVGASLTMPFLLNYQNEKFDLRYALEHSTMRKIWSFSYDYPETEVRLKKERKTSERFRSSLPAPGFFSREHEVIGELSQTQPNAIERFDIDGAWDIDEMSNFYGNMGDIYAIVADMEIFENKDTPYKVKQRISTAFEKPFRGGGSYLSFFRDAANDNIHAAPLKVSGIKYNSPGYVEVKANSEYFHVMLSLLETYSRDKFFINLKYTILRNFLSRNKLLKRASYLGTNAALSAQIADLARDLDTSLPGISYDALLEMSDGNHLASSKVLLSIVRRVKRLFKFFEEGRVSYGQIDATITRAF